MTGKITINGLGRIGRATLTLAMEQPEPRVMAVNELGPVENFA